MQRITGKQVVLAKRRLLARSGSLCECPLCQAGHPLKLTWATSEVDHTIPLFEGGTNAFTNLRVLHVECHARITREQQARIANHTWTDRMEVQR